MLQVKISKDCDDVRSYQGTKYAPVQLVYSMDVFGCQWHARQTNWRGSETTQSNQGLLWERTKRITGDVVPNQAWFGTEYFLAYTLPNFKSKILTWLSDAQKDNSLLLFSLMGQCFQDVGLTKWTSVMAKRCPEDADRTKANFDKCIRDYLKAIAGFPNIGDQLICWLCTAKKPLSCQCTSSCIIEYSFSATSGATTSVEQLMYPRSKRRVNKFSLCSLRGTRTSSPTWTRWYLPNRSEWLPFLAVSSNWHGSWHSQEDCQGQEAAKGKKNGSCSYRT